MILQTCSVFDPYNVAHARAAAPTASLKPSTGIWQMPNARVLPDWSIRFKYGSYSPYRYYGGALGLLDRMEVYGKFTEITTLEPFSYDYKDRSAGAKFVLKKESEIWPQIALGVNDVTGTALFSSRYLAASKKFQGLDLTLGIGQGSIAGDPVYQNPGQDKAVDFFTSDLDRRTRLFGGLEYEIAPWMTFSAEYSSQEPKTMKGYMTASGERVKNDDSKHPLNYGLKFNYNRRIHAQISLMRGTTVAGGVECQLPLEPQGMRTWKKSSPVTATEKLRRRAYKANNRELSRIIANKISARGLENIAVSCSNSSAWIEFRNSRHLSDSRALGHVGKIADTLLPPRIRTIYLNISEKGSVVQSLKTDRESLHSFLNGSTDKEQFFASSKLELYTGDHYENYKQDSNASEAYHYQNNFTYSIQPRLKTFLNNKAGFFKHKGVLELSSNYNWDDLTAYGQLDLTLFNQFDELVWSPLEKDAVRTDIIEYKEKSRPRLTELALEYKTTMPYNIQTKFSAGIFTTAYTGLGMELFRFFNHGLWGMGVESQAVRKRDVKNNFQLDASSNNWYYTGYLNIYAQLWPSQGIECGLKAGRFLAGDPGVRIELRRSFKYFTIGGWSTYTDTNRFESSENKNANDKGIFIRIPFSVFRDRDTPGHFEYSIRSFTRDQGQTISTPSSLFPEDPWSTPDHTNRNAHEMKRF